MSHLREPTLMSSFEMMPLLDLNVPLPILPGIKFKSLEFNSCENICSKNQMFVRSDSMACVSVKQIILPYFVVFTFKNVFVQKDFIDKEYDTGCLFPTFDTCVTGRPSSTTYSASLV